MGCGLESQRASKVWLRVPGHTLRSGRRVREGRSVLRYSHICKWELFFFKNVPQVEEFGL